MTVEDYLDLNWTYLIRPKKQVGWFIRIKEMPACMSQGDNLPEAFDNIKEVLAEHIEGLLYHGIEIPEPEKFINFRLFVQEAQAAQF